MALFKIVSKLWPVESSPICVSISPNSWVGLSYSILRCPRVHLSFQSVCVCWKEAIDSSRISFRKFKMRIGSLSWCVPSIRFHLSLMFSSLRNDQSLPMSLEFIRTRSYVNERSTAELEIIGLSDLSTLKNKHLLIFEDIIDTGATMVQLKKQLEGYHPKTIHVVSLFTKRRRDKNCVFKPDYCGFEIPDHFIVGYALVRSTVESEWSIASFFWLTGLQWILPWSGTYLHFERVRCIEIQGGYGDSSGMNSFLHRKVSGMP